jgi:hypothetical protein
MLLLGFFFHHHHFYTFLPSFFSDHGKVLKTINAASADESSKVASVVIEELDVLAKPEPIRNLKIVRTMQYGECVFLVKVVNLCLIYNMHELFLRKLLFNKHKL